jgi:hypothetical protein
MSDAPEESPSEDDLAQIAGAIALGAANLLVLRDSLDKIVHRLAGLAVSLRSAEGLAASIGGGTSTDDVYLFVRKQMAETLQDLDVVNSGVESMCTMMRAKLAEAD